MHSILLTVASAFVATTFAGPSLHIRGTPVGLNECSFIAEVNYAHSSGVTHHCWIEAVLPPVKGERASTCANVAFAFIKSTNARSCAMFLERLCADSPGIGAQGRLCAGDYTGLSLREDKAIIGMLMNCF
ncbi:hypothetical protein BGZ82_001260, partial [Podila clonocystis]